MSTGLARMTTASLALPLQPAGGEEDKLEVTESLATAKVNKLRCS